jgi:hypothetical protein
VAQDGGSLNYFSSSSEAIDGNVGVRPIKPDAWTGAGTFFQPRGEKLVPVATAAGQSLGSRCNANEDRRHNKRSAADRRSAQIL